MDIARSKVEAALSPAAFGHGVPDLQNLSTNEILMAGIPVLGSILVFMAARMLLSSPRKKGRDIVVNQE